MSRKTYCASDKCEFEVLEKQDLVRVKIPVTTTSGTQLLSGEPIEYPEGFNKDNTFLISHSIKTDFRQTKYVTTYGVYPDFMFTDTINIRYLEEKMYLFGRLPEFEVGTNVTIELLLLKID